jgi:transcriptional regulator with XRE-family HTH domain
MKASFDCPPLWNAESCIAAVTSKVIERDQATGEGDGAEGVNAVSLSILQRRSGRESGFPRLLKTWRQKRRMSQLELALTSGVQQRHVGFLESGRARPSHRMLLELSETLEVPLRERNNWHTAAGSAPILRARSLDDSQMSQVMNAVRLMLSNHEPFPAIAIDSAWSIRLSNRPFELLAAMLGSDVWSRIGGRNRNLMRLMFHPNGIRPYVANWHAIAPVL